MKRTPSSLLVVASLMAATAFAQAPTLATQRTVKADEVQSTESESAVGSLFPSKMLPLGFELGGRLQSSRVQKGDVVKAGQALGSLDPEMVETQVAQAEAGLLAAEAGSMLASDMAGRQEKLKDEGSVSDVASRSADTQSKQAQAQVMAAKAQLAQARSARRKHDLKAPFAGTLIDAPDQVGGMVGPGTPVYILMQLDPLVLKTTIPESLRAAVKAGLKVRVDSVGSGATTDQAQVKVVLPSADPQTRRVPIEVLVPNADGRFVANTMARVNLRLGAARSAYRIPATALGSTGGEHVFAVGLQGELRRVPVTVVERGPKDVTVVSAQALGEVVDYPTSALVDGARVTLR
jgi:membrane fusion protein (multidrug efflux system)